MLSSNDYNWWYLLPIVSCLQIYLVILFYLVGLAFGNMNFVKYDCFTCRLWMIGFQIVNGFVVSLFVILYNYPKSVLFGHKNEKSFIWLFFSVCRVNMLLGWVPWLLLHACWCQKWPLEVSENVLNQVDCQKMQKKYWDVQYWVCSFSSAQYLDR